MMINIYFKLEFGPLKKRNEKCLQEDSPILRDCFNHPMRLGKTR